MVKNKRSSKQRMPCTLFLVAVLAVLYFTSSMVLAINSPEKETFETAGDIGKTAFIRLLADTFDPLCEKPDIPRALEIHDAQGYYIVQFNGPIHEEWRSSLEELGVTILGYIPDYAFIVKMDDGIKKNVALLPNIRWIGLYHPAYKIQNRLLEKTGEMELNVLVFKDTKQNLLKVRNRLSELGGIITYDGEDNHIIRVRIDASGLRSIAFIPEVEWIDEYTPPIPLMNNIRGFTGANIVHFNGFNGSGIVGEVKDGGIDLNHPDFAGQIIGTDGPISDDDHGTCTFGIVFSSGTNNANAKGMLPGGKGVFCYSWGVPRTTSISNLVNNWGGVFQSNSWIQGWLDSDYTSFSQEDDQTVFDYNVVMVYGAGNSNFGVYPESCSQDSVAKNVICVGALWHHDDTDWNNDEWTDLGPGITPSQGPASDGRIKPDLSGPFDLIYTTDSVDGDGEDGYAVGNYYDDFGGTSGATPVVAGATGLVYQMYKENHFGNNPAGNLPNASTVKAILIADAHQYEFFEANRYQQGWGGVDIGDVYTIGEDHFIVDESKPLRTGDSVKYSIVPTGVGPLKISLVWTDVPGTTSSSQHLVNDLDLKVTDPDGVVYWGNHNLNTSKWSASGGTADSLNNVENVFIETPTPGTWTLEIIGANIPLDGEPSTPLTDQAFALVASNAGETLSVDISYPSSGAFVNDIVTITGNASGDVTQVEVKIDNGGWELASGTSVWSYDWNTLSFLDGVHTIYIRGFNGSAYSNIESVTVIVDNTPPTTWDAIGEPKYFNGSLWFVRASTQFILSAFDTGSGVNATYHKILHEGIKVKDWAVGNLFTLSWGEGNYSIQYYSDDILENEEDNNTINVYLDSTSPTTQMDIGSPKHRNASSDYWNITTKTNFTLSPFEEHTGIESTWYTIDGEYFEGLNFNFTDYDDGLHTITWGSRDHLGNDESGNLIIVNLDTISPVIELIIEEPKYRAVDNDSWNVTSATNFKLLPFDGHSGINFTWYSIDGVYFEGGKFTFEGHSDGLHEITWGAEDNLGNNVTGPITTIFLDSQPPITKLVIGEPKHGSSNNDSWNVTKNTTFNLIANDEYAGVRNTWYRINGISYEGCEFNLSGLSDDTYTITWGSVDNLGQNEDENTVIVNLDTRPPRTNIAIGEPKHRELMEDNWNITTATLFTLSPLDPFSGTNFTWYLIDNKYFEGTSFDLLGYEEGYHTIVWGSIDHLGNNETDNILTIYLNLISPETTLEIEGPKYRMMDDELFNVTDKTLFALHPANTHPGIHFSWYTIDDEYFEGTSFKLSNHNEGAHYITWGSEDNLGLNETGNSITVILDTTPPDTNIEIGEPKYRENSEDPWVVNAATIFKLTSTDEDSGVDFTWYGIDGVYFIGTTFTLSGYADGPHIITWGSQDNGGNNMTEKSTTMYVDDTPPTTMIEIDTPYHVSEEVTYVDTTAKVNLFWDDDSGVGTSTVWYSLDGGNTYKTYVAPFTLSIGVNSIMYGAEDLVGNNATPTILQIIVDETDTDSDGIYDIIDDDDDSDGIMDESDAYPHDTDNDGIENALDPDDDADGIIDDVDPYPFDTDNDGKRNDIDEDDDGDGINDTIDPYLLDTDNDGKKNDIDLDDDADGLEDIKEIEIGTDILNPDTDGDGHRDGVDAYPLDKNRWDSEETLLYILLMIFVIAAVVTSLLFLIIRRQMRYSEKGVEGIDTEEPFPSYVGSKPEVAGAGIIGTDFKEEVSIGRAEREIEDMEQEIPPPPPIALPEIKDVVHELPPPPALPETKDVTRELPPPPIAMPETEDVTHEIPPPPIAMPEIKDVIHELSPTPIVETEEKEVHEGTETFEPTEEIEFGVEEEEIGEDIKDVTHEIPPTPLVEAEEKEVHEGAETFEPTEEIEFEVEDEDIEEDIKDVTHELPPTPLVETEEKEVTEAAETFEPIEEVKFEEEKIDERFLEGQPTDVKIKKKPKLKKVKVMRVKRAGKDELKPETRGEDTY